MTPNPHIFPAENGYWYQRTNPVSGETRPHGPFNTMADAQAAIDRAGQSDAVIRGVFAVDQIDRITDFDPDISYVVTLRSRNSMTRSVTFDITPAQLNGLRVLLNTTDAVQP